jgi:hypothetical protein
MYITKTYLIVYQHFIVCRRRYIGRLRQNTATSLFGYGLQGLSSFNL